MKRLIISALFALLAFSGVARADQAIISRDGAGLPTGWTIVGAQLKAADGSVSAPALVGSDTDTGLYFNPSFGGSRSIKFAIDGADVLSMRDQLFEIKANTHLRWNTTTPDLGLLQSAPGVLNVTDGGSTELVTLWNFGVSVQSDEQFLFSSSASDSSASNDAGIKRLTVAWIQATDGGSGFGSIATSRVAFTNKLTATVDSATTFAVTSTYMVLACTGAETINTATAGTTGQILYLEHTDTECTIADDDNATAANAFNLTGTATNDVGATAKYLVFIFDGNAWQQIGESANN